MFNTSLNNGGHGALIYSYDDGRNFVRIYSDKFCVQGSSEDITNSFNTSVKTITLLQPYRDTNYVVKYQMTTSYTGSVNLLYQNVKEKTTTTFSTNYTIAACWSAEGYIA